MIVPQGRARERLAMKYRITGWEDKGTEKFTVTERFVVVCDYQEAQKYLELMEKRNNKNTKVKIDSIEVIY